LRVVVAVTVIWLVVVRAAAVAQVDTVILLLKQLVLQQITQLP
jgi:hypothetical protein